MPANHFLLRCWRTGDASMSIRSTLATLALSLGAVVALAAPASAHAELAWTTPSAGSSLKVCPSHVIMHFTEAVATGGLTVSTGKVPLASQAAVDNQTFVVTTGGRCTRHSLVLTWRTVSADDGHVASGDVAFKVGVARSVSASASTVSTPATPMLGSTRATIAFRTLGYLAMAGFIGGLVFLCLIWPEGAQVRSSRRILVLSVIAGVASSVGSLVAVAAQTTSSYDIAAVLDQAFGREYAATALLWLLAGIVVVDLWQRGRHVLDRSGWRISATFAGAGLIFMEGRTAHASQSANSAWGTASDFLHITCMSVWVGGLIMLVACVLPRRHIDELDAVVPRFSTLAQLAVVGVVASGMLLVCEVIAPIPDFWNTHYTHVLLIKLGILAAALAAAYFSKRWVDRRMARSGRRSAGVRPIAVSIGAEAALAIGVLIAAGTLVSSSPGL